MKPETNSYSDPLSFIWNGKRPEEFGFYLYDLPTIQTSNEDYEVISVPGMRGQLIRPGGSFRNIQINIQLAMLNRRLLPSLRALRSLLRCPGELRLTELEGSFYKVLQVEHGDLTRQLRRFGTVPITFVALPYEYEASSFVPRKVKSGSFFNPYDEAAPVYRIFGEGICELSVNGAIMKADVGQSLTIDTARMCAYKSDQTMSNTSVTGDYATLKLASGENRINVSEGFELEIVPCWGWKT